MILRYLDEVAPDPALMKEVLPALEANNNWWLTQRATRFGLIYCDNGLETGQDNSPRFDKGPILALDMNSYLVNQMRVTSEIARRLGQKRKAATWAKAADTHAARMVKYLYDPTQNLFFDADAATGKRQSLISASAFLPLPGAAGASAAAGSSPAVSPMVQPVRTSAPVNTTARPRRALDRSPVARRPVRSVVRSFTDWPLPNSLFHRAWPRPGDVYTSMPAEMPVLHIETPRAAGSPALPCRREHPA